VKGEGNHEGVIVYSTIAQQAYTRSQRPAKRRRTMPLAAGTRLGPYEILGLIGAGGMGEVYKATDTRLDRTVAIKVLPDHISADLDRRARFEREAKTIGGLSHPHICTLYDVGDHAGSMFLVMEHLDGETLARRVEKGALPIGQAVAIATDIADALSAAHRRGVVHRDLKPGNVMLTKSGAKLLDFGLAKLTDHGDQAALAQVVSVPTRSAPLTGEGVIVGTLQYMAPEQLEGKPADARTDLWALGAILYEIVSGKRAFEASSAASLIGAILEREPAPLVSVQPLAPTGLDRLVRRCLAKSPDDRPDTAHDLASDLRFLSDNSGVAAVAGTHPGSTVPRAIRSLALVMAGAALASGSWWLSVLLHPIASPTQSIQAEISVEPAEELNAGGVASGLIPTAGGSRTALTWTPDGRSIIFVGRRRGVFQLYARPLDATQARPLAGTEGAQAFDVSPDGQWVCFWAANAIRKVSLVGGPVMELVSGIMFLPTSLLCQNSGRAFFGKHGDGIWQAEAGEAARRLTTLGDAERTHIVSSTLPGEHTLIYTVRKRHWSWGDEEVVALDVASGRRTVLLHDAADARYVSTHHLVFLRRGGLFAVPFDTAQVRVSGPEVLLLNGVSQALSGVNASDLTGAGQFTISGSGSLAWIPAATEQAFHSVLVAVDRHGRVAPLGSPVQSYSPALRVSPDGHRLAVTIRTLTESGLWMYDLERKGVLTPLHRGDEADWPIWSSDGQHIVFSGVNKGQSFLGSQPADGSRPPEILTRDHLAGQSSWVSPSSWVSADRVLGVNEGHLVIASLANNPGTVELLGKTTDVENWPDLSPDGRWLAYGSNASGQGFDVYIRPYPGPGASTRVSVDGGASPAWDPSGSELFYISPTDGAGNRRMMVVPFLRGAPPRLGTPRVLFEFDPRKLGFGCVPVRCYDVAPGGERFYVTQSADRPAPPVVSHINLVLNWFEELKAKAPMK
jgi:eukaryotic-like serine/threonine-protein kinase